MKFLRTVSTRRLLAIIVGIVSAIVAGAAIAVAAQGSGPVPPPKPLRSAIHSALAAPAPKGITASISFTNHLIDASDLQGSDPILSGATGRLWLSQGHRLRLELQSDNGDAQIVVNGRSFWVYDPSANTVYKGTLPADHGGATGAKGQAAKGAKARAGADQLPSLAEIQTYLNRIAQHANLSGAIPSDVAGRPAYTVRISPKHDGGLLGAGELAWDAIRGVPLRLAVYAQGDSNPVLELKATDISYGPVDKSAFTITPPKTAKVVTVNTAQAARTHAGAAKKLRGHRKDVTGAAAVAKRLPFKLVAPAKLVGLPRQSVQLLDWGGHPAALVTYGQNLGGVMVIEQSKDTAKSAGPAGASGKNGPDHRGLNLPTVSINGASGQELDTALGTIVRFDRGGVTYTVVGSVPAAAADAAARAL
jgi:outer membrane lipoprotein-sorting protein